MTEKEDLLHILDLGPEGPSPEGPRGGHFAPRTSGAPRKTFYVEYVRDLTEADMAALALPRGNKVPQIQRIHSSHHALARCLATGMKPAQAALVTGYTTVRIRQLAEDEAFKALLADYTAEAKSHFADLAERMNSMSLDAIEVLQDRLHASPETFSVNALLEIVKTFADRTGHGPGQDVNFKMSVDLIDRPPRENFEEWQARRDRELGGGAQQVLPPPSSNGKKPH